MAQPAGPVPFARPPPLAGGSGAFRRPAPAPAPHASPHGKGKAVLDLLDLTDDDGHARAPFKRARDVEEEPGLSAARNQAGELVLSSDDEYRYMDLDWSDVDPAEFRAAQRAKDLSRSASPAVAAGPAPAWPNDPLEDAVATIADILPDVDCAAVRALLEEQPAHGPANVEAVLEQLFSMEGGYPKRALEPVHNGRDATGADAKGKGKSREEDVPTGAHEDDEEVVRVAKQWLDTSARQAGGRAYQDAALAQLSLDFRNVRQTDLKKLFAAYSSFYAPTYIGIVDGFKQPINSRPFTLIGNARIDKGKGKDRVVDELDRERRWVREERSRYDAALARTAELEARLEAEIASGAYFECGCCFADTALSQIVACAEGCQFCKDCARMNADSQIGMRKYVLPCMATSGCSSTFLENEYPLFLSATSIAALHKIRQEKEVYEAELEGLEHCPFCPFAYVIENPHERLFFCQRGDCRIISCRQCKKKDHLPATCAEASDNAKLSTVHRVEEAMSEALIRRCPKLGCGEPYVKETGTCNKIVCSSCRTLSCYICNKIIDGYQHFKNPGSNLPAGTTVEAGTTCELWDDTDKRNYQEVEAARLAAEADARAANPALADEDLDKLAMAQPLPPPPNIAHLPPPRVDARVQAILQERERQAAQPRGGPPPAPRPSPPKPAARQPRARSPPPYVDPWLQQLRHQRYPPAAPVQAPAPAPAPAPPPVAGPANPARRARFAPDPVGGDAGAAGRAPAAGPRQAAGGILKAVADRALPPVKPRPPPNEYFAAQLRAGEARRAAEGSGAADVPGRRRAAPGLFVAGWAAQAQRDAAAAGGGEPAAAAPRRAQTGPVALDLEARARKQQAKAKRAGDRDDEREQRRKRTKGNG